MLSAGELDERCVGHLCHSGACKLDGHDRVGGPLQEEHRLMDGLEHVPGAHPSLHHREVAAGDRTGRAGALHHPPRGVDVRDPGEVGVGDPGEPAASTVALAPVLGSPAYEIHELVERRVAHRPLRAPVKCRCRRVEHDELADAVRSSGRRQTRGHAALGDPDHSHTFKFRSVHHGNELLDAKLKRGSPLDRIGDPGPGLVIHSHAREPGELGKESPRSPELPEEVDVGYPARDEEDLGGALPEHLPGDAHTIVLEIVRLGDLHAVVLLRRADRRRANRSRFAPQAVVSLDAERVSAKDDKRAYSPMLCSYLSMRRPSYQRQLPSEPTTEIDPNN